MTASLALWRLAVPLAIVLLGRRARFLTTSGSIAALLVGSAVVLRGWDVTAMLVLFFVLGSVATKIRHKEKEAAMPYPETQGEATRRAHEAAATLAGGPQRTNGVHANGSQGQAAAGQTKHQGRDMWQVLATGLVPALICALQPLFPDAPSSPSSLLSSAEGSSFLSAPPSRPLWFLAYLAFVATCCGDTLASEIGMLARQKPLMLWRRQRVPRGVDGGMTLLGTAASVAGGAIIGACTGTLFDVYCGAIYGCIGSLFDSLLGTFLQSKQYVVPAATSAPAGKHGADGFVDSAQAASAPLPLKVATWKQLNNFVNMLSSGMAAVLAIAVQHWAITQGVQLLPFLALLCALLLLTVTPGMRPLFATAGCAALTALWSIVYADLPQQQRVAVLPLALAYVAWRVRG